MGRAQRNPSCFRVVAMGFAALYPSYNPAADGSLLAMAIKRNFASSRHVLPELCKFLVLALEVEGAGKAGCRLTPAVSCAELHIVGAHEHTGSAETARPSPR